MMMIINNGTMIVFRSPWLNEIEAKDVRSIASISLNNNEESVDNNRES